MTTTGSGKGTSGTVNVPITNSAGDYLLAIVSCDVATLTVTPPTGGTWTEIYGGTLSAVDGQAYHVYVNTSGPGSASYDWGFSAGTIYGCSVVMLAESDHDGTTPTNITGITVTDSSNASPIAVVSPSVTTTVNGCRIVAAYVLDVTANVTTSATPAAGYSSVTLQDASASYAHCGLSYNTQATAGATGTITTTVSGATAAMVAFTIAIAPASGTPGVYTLSATSTATAITAGTQTLTYAPGGATYTSIGTIAYSAASGASVAPTYPTGITSTSALLMIVGQKPTTANGGTVTTPSGWTLIGSLAGAGGYSTTTGADVGNTNVFAYSKNSVSGSESGSVTVTIGDNSVSWGAIISADRHPSTSGWSIAVVTGSDTSAGNVSITFGSDPGIAANDTVIAAMVIPTDVTTPSQFSAEAITTTGVTYGTVTEIGEPDSTAGNDIGGVICYAKATAGPSSAAPVFTATAGGTTTNVRGPGVFIRLRATTVTNYTLTATSTSTAITTGSQGVLAARKLTASSASVALTAATQTLTYNASVAYTLGATSTATAITAGSQSLLKSRKLTATSGSVALTAASQTLTYTSSAGVVFTWPVAAATAGGNNPDTAEYKWSNQSLGFVDSSVAGSAQKCFILHTFAASETSLWLYPSTNGVSFGTPVSLGQLSPNNYGCELYNAFQDSAGKVHLLYSAAGNTRYRRLALTHSGSVITGASQEADFALFTSAANTRFGLCELTTDSRIALVYSNDDTANIVASTLPINATSTSGILGLDGGAAWTVVDTFRQHAHEQVQRIIQFPSNGTVLIFTGEALTEYPVTSMRHRYCVRASANTWTLGTIVDEGSPVAHTGGICFDGGYVYRAAVGDSSSNRLMFDRFSDSGTVTQDIFPFVAFTDWAGLVQISVSGTHAYFVAIDYTGRQSFGYYNGTSWTTETTPTIGVISYVVGCVGITWSTGVAVAIANFYGPAKVFFASSVSTIEPAAYSLSATSTSTALTAGSQSILASRKLTASSASVAITAQNQAATVTRKLTANSASTTATAQSQGLRASRLLTATSTATNATAASQSVKASRSLTATSAGVAISAQSAGVRATRRLSATSTATSITAQSQAVKANRVLTASAASVAATVQTVTITHTAFGAYVMVALPASTTATGSASILATRRLTATSASTSITGQSQAIRSGRILAALPASVVATAQTAGLLRAARLVASSASVGTSWASVTIGWTPAGSWTLAALPASVVVTASNQALRAGRVLTTQTASVATSATSVSISTGHTLTAQSAAFASDWSAVEFLRARVLAATSTAIAATWQTVALTYSGIPDAEPWSITGTVYRGITFLGTPSRYLAIIGRPRK